MRKTIISLALFFVAATALAQTDEAEKPQFARSYFGPGMGLDYGGFGVNIMVMPAEHLGLFLGAGYNLVGVGFNGGARLFLNRTTHTVRPYFTGMYGYNTVIRVSGAEQYNKVFYGGSIGFGLDIAASRDNRFWTIALNVPLRGSEVDSYVDSLKGKGITFTKNLLPVAITIGYRIGN